MTRERYERRLRAVRVRATVVAVLVIAFALVAAGIGLVVGLRTELSDDVRDAARARASDVARVIEAGRGVPAPTVTAPDEEFLQVVAADGTVVAASENVEGKPALARLAPGESASVDTLLDDDPFLVVAVGARDDGRELVVLDGRDASGVTEATDTVTWLLLIGLPVLLALAAAATWIAVGRALRRVARAEAAQRRFVSDASHELRSPVATVRQHAEVALAHPERTDPRSLAGTVREEAVRMQRLVDDLLLLARADESALLRGGPRPVDLDDLVLAEVRRLRSASPAALRVDSRAVGAARVTGDAEALRRLVRNLGENAARHARTRVAFTLTDAGDGWVRLVVEDDGPGIPAAERARVLDRFVRLDESRARGAGGAGLGLAIVAEVAGAHRGRVEVGVSEGLGGARFTVGLPSAGE
ncbi:HAMP domain-containing histidine kinase [Streptomyces cyaneochromogenes]|uniref:histidine kinase n=1 Tax=Streptomyces cyaneochromogenes TaxID=2496836 RepID=A0A3S9M5V0_9ACTN|nr:HAMP domain-containing sensor histidine kinase [Streptomyces cyaneochromogenes]AZQ34534.1 HAMP domain-containing histidine kinase [Streptomyces cyaneochromogenes]